MHIYAKMRSAFGPSSRVSLAALAPLLVGGLTLPVTPAEALRSAYCRPNAPGGYDCEDVGSGGSGTMGPFGGGPVQERPAPGTGGVNPGLGGTRYFPQPDDPRLPRPPYGVQPPRYPIPAPTPRPVMPGGAPHVVLPWAGVPHGMRQPHPGFGRPPPPWGLPQGMRQPHPGFGLPSPPVAAQPPFGFCQRRPYAPGC